jgi:lysophospholipase L1-like esterase
MTRLPTPGQDQGQWGDILNDYLSVSHASDGSLKGGTVGTTQLQDNSITGTKLANDTIPAGKLTPTTQTSLTKADSSVQSVNAVFPSTGNVTLTPSDIGAASQSALTALDTAVEKTSQLDTTGHAASKAALDALSGSVVTKAQFISRRANTIVFLGDSNTANGGGPGVNPSTRVTGVFGWLNALLGHRMTVLYNAGVGGETSTQILARIQTDVIVKAPSWCHILAGTNDFGTSTVIVDIATSKTNILAMVDACFAESIGVVVGTIPPRGAGGSNTRSGAALMQALAFNEWIRRALPILRPGVEIVDYHQACAIPGTDQWRTGYSQADGTHWKSEGAWAAGNAALTTFTRIMRPLPRVIRVASQAENLIPVALGQFGSGGQRATLSAALSTGAAITSLPVAALASSIASGTVLTLTDGAGHTQTWTSTTAASAAATTIVVASQTPNFAYPSGAVLGTAPVSWTTTASAGTTFTTVTGTGAGTDDLGDWLEITVPTGGTVSMARDITTATAVGDVLTSAVEHYASGIETPTTPTVANNSVAFGLSMNSGVIPSREFSTVTGSDQAHGSFDRGSKAVPLVLESPPYTRLATDTQIQVLLVIQGGGTYRFRCATVTKA